MSASLHQLSLQLFFLSVLFHVMFNESVHVRWYFFFWASLSRSEENGINFNIMAAFARHYFPIGRKYFILAWGWREELKGKIGIWHTILPLLACPLVQNSC